MQLLCAGFRCAVPSNCTACLYRSGTGLIGGGSLQRDSARCQGVVPERVRLARERDGLSRPSPALARLAGLMLGGLLAIGWPVAAEAAEPALRDFAVCGTVRNTCVVDGDTFGTPGLLTATSPGDSLPCAAATRPSIGAFAPAAPRPGLNNAAARPVTRSVPPTRPRQHDPNLWRTAAAGASHSRLRRAQAKGA